MKDIRKKHTTHRRADAPEKMKETGGEVGAWKDTFPTAFYDKQPLPPL
jgi:hypothetical protein